MKKRGFFIMKQIYNKACFFITKQNGILRNLASFF